jgi:hypothetical protein
MVVREFQESLTFVERGSQLWVAQQEESEIRRRRYVPFGRRNPIETSSFRRIRRLVPLFPIVIVIQPGVECSGDVARLRRPFPQLQRTIDVLFFCGSQVPRQRLGVIRQSASDHRELKQIQPTAQASPWLSFRLSVHHRQAPNSSTG